MTQYAELREKYPCFRYRGYDVQEDQKELKVTYRFETEGLASFAPCWRFPKAGEDSRRWAEDHLMQRMLFSLGMVELVSYWKITCSPQVIVEAGPLDEAQAEWWKELYFNGLGEFFYVNHIEEAKPDTFMQIVSKAPEHGSEEFLDSAHPAVEHLAARPGLTDIAQDRAEGNPESGTVRALVPVGGGKDSAVTLELLRSAGACIYGYIINPRGATLNTVQAAGLEDSHVIKASRTLDPRMLELNRQGYLNGHTPFSALVAFSSIIAARMHGLERIALSNESSANESTVMGSTVNHQYSKSFKFEKDFHQYQTRYLPGSAYYFSLLRPLSEFQIARYFAAQKQYHRIFRSCNAGSKTDSWCGRCPKCLFVYLILSPFLSRREVRDIFGRDMLQDMEMKDTLEQLVGIQEEKPFECVGSRDEINTAATFAIDRIEGEKEALPALLSYYKSTGLYDKYKAAGDRYSSYYDDNNLVPEPWAALVRKKCTDTL